MPCTDNAWYDVLKAFNTYTTEHIRVPRKALAEVLECSKTLGNSITGLVAREPRSDSATVEVNRAALFELIRSHNCEIEARRAASDLKNSL